MVKSIGGLTVRCLVGIEGPVVLPTHKGFPTNGVAKTLTQTILLFLVTDLLQCLMGEVMTSDDAHNLHKYK